MDSYTIREVTLVWHVTNTVSKDVPLVERYINCYQWYKHFHPTMKVNSTIKGHDMLFITLMIPVLKDNNKIVPVKAIFDFKLGIMKMRHVSP